MPVYRFTAKPVVMDSSGQDREPSPGIVNMVEIVFAGNAKQAFEALKQHFGKDLAWRYDMQAFKDGTILNLQRVVAAGMPQPNSQEAPMAGDEAGDFFGSELMF